MKSTVYHHFPRFIVESEQKWLFNPILKKRYKNLPEERVRLRWAEYLLSEAGWKKTRIAFESPVTLSTQSRRGRTDLLLYSDAMKPQVLIECKAETISLNSSVAMQAARYNCRIGAPIIILTNGITDYFFELKKGSPISVKNPFKKTGTFFERDLTYWADRAFCSKESHRLVIDRIPGILNTIYNHDACNDVRYLAFTESFLPFPTGHYYRIYPLSNGKKLAIAFLGQKKTGSYCVAILNKDGKNEGILIMHLDKFAAKESDSVILVQQGETSYMQPLDHLYSRLGLSAADFAKNLHKELLNFFD